MSTEYAQVSPRQYPLSGAVKHACRIITDNNLVHELDQKIVYSADVAKRNPIITHAGKGGRNRTLPYSALVGILITYALMNPSNMLITHVHAFTTHRLKPRHLEQLGVRIPGHYKDQVKFRLSYDQLTRALRTLAQFLDGGLQRCDHDGVVSSELTYMGTVNDFITQLLRSSIPDEVLNNNTTHAIDGTSVLSHIHPTSGHHHSHTNDTTVYVGDPDARFGHRTPTGSDPDDMFLGYHAHLATPLPNIAGEPIPELVSGFALTPANVSGTEGTTRTLHAMETAGIAVNEVVVDRGIAPNPHFTTYLLNHNITVTQDYKKPGFSKKRVLHPGIIMHAGTVLSTGCPSNLQVLDKIPAPWTPDYVETTSELISQYEARKPWTFTPHSTPEQKKNGTWVQRFAGPALTNKVRCPTYPRSLRKNPATAPTCSGQNCGCAKTITLTEEQLKHVQHYNYGTFRWFQSYSRRSQVERINSRLKSNDVSISGGFTRVAGTTKKGLLIGLYIVGYNLRATRQWYLEQNTQDPWAEHIPDLAVHLPPENKRATPKKATAPPYWALTRTPHTQEEFYKALHKYQDSENTF